MFVHKYFLEHSQIALEHGGFLGGRRLHGMKIRRAQCPAFLGIAVGVGQHRQQRGCVIPSLPDTLLGHPQQLPQRQPAGIDADDAGTLPDKLPDSIWRKLSANCRSISGESSRASTAASALA